MATGPPGPGISRCPAGPVRAWPCSQTSGSKRAVVLLISRTSVHSSISHVSCSWSSGHNSSTHDDPSVTFHVPDPPVTWVEESWPEDHEHGTWLMDHHGSRNRDRRIRNMKRDWWIIMGRGIVTGGSGTWNVTDGSSWVEETWPEDQEHETWLMDHLGSRNRDRRIRNMKRDWWIIMGRGIVTGGSWTWNVTDGSSWVEELWPEDQEHETWLMDHHGSRNRDWRIRNMKRDWWIIMGRGIVTGGSGTWSVTDGSSWVEESWPEDHEHGTWLMDHHGSRNCDRRIRNMKRDWWIIMGRGIVTGGSGTWNVTDESSWVEESWP